MKCPTCGRRARHWQVVRERCPRCPKSPSPSVIVPPRPVVEPPKTPAARAFRRATDILETARDNAAVFFDR